jgi:hypothetical protein
MKIEYRPHALDQMRRRHITKRQVRFVLEAPTSVEFDPNQVSMRLERFVNNRILKVWVRAPWPPASDTVTVKSTAWKGRS